MGRTMQVFLYIFILDLPSSVEGETPKRLALTKLGSYFFCY